MPRLSFDEEYAYFNELIERFEWWPFKPGICGPHRERVATLDEFSAGQYERCDFGLPHFKDRFWEVFVYAGP